MKYLPVAFLIILLFSGIVTAVPTTPVVSAISNNNATFTSGSVTGSVGWFDFGMASGAAWASLPNVTSNGGVITYTMAGSPLGYNNVNYFITACDPTGCSGQATFQTLTVTPLPTTTFGQFAQNMTQNGFSPANAVTNALQPYVQVTTATLLYGIILMALFVGLWLRTRGTTMALQLGMLMAGLFVSSVIGLQLGLPPEFVAAGQAIMYVSLAGAVVSFTFK